MRSAILAKIVLAFLGMTAIGALVALATGVTTASRECPRFRLVPHEDSFPARAKAPHGRPPSTAPASSPGETSGAARRMFLDGVTKDFGAVPRAARLFHRFPIVNVYAAPMAIDYLQVSCGCVTATTPKRILQPREKSTIDVLMDTRDFTGPNMQNVRVKVVGPGLVSTCKLAMSAVGRADIVFKPGQVSFGTVGRADDVPPQTIDVEYAGALDWQLKEVVVAKELPFEVMLNERYRRPGQVGYRLTVTLEDRTGVGTIKDNVYLKTNDPGAPVLPLLVEATVKETLTDANSTGRETTVSRRGAPSITTAPAGRATGARLDGQSP